MGSQTERTGGKVMLEDPARQQIVDWVCQAAVGRLSIRPRNPGLQLGEIKPQTTD